AGSTVKEIVEIERASRRSAADRVPKQLPKNRPRQPIDRGAPKSRLIGNLRGRHRHFADRDAVNTDGGAHRSIPGDWQQVSRRRGEVDVDDANRTVGLGGTHTDTAQ